MTIGFREKVLGILAAMAAIFVLLGAIGWFWLGQTRSAVQQENEMNEALIVLGQTGRRMAEVRASVVAHVGAATNADYRRQLDERIAQLDTQIAQGLDQLQALAHTPEEQERTAAVREAWTTYRASAERTLQFSRKDDLVAAQQNMTGDAAQKFAALLDAIRNLEQASSQDAQAIVQRAESQLTMLRFAMLGAAGLAVVAFLGGLLVLRPALRTVAEIAGASQQLAEQELAALETALGKLAAGDLTARFAVTMEPLPVRGRDELARMAQSFNRMLERLRAVGSAFGNALDDLAQLVGQVRLAVR